ncbi:hypothetical protein FLONG3_6759 [Fusarium longipes]|uniref:Uncharacterized protein n=1 Tax=Fusarium longipes TaxID=694270 RepID=A0A395SIU5_9HYPO|nr:hypothetical protein FLONG3_6759 [Fusarium longipes]
MDLTAPDEFDEDLGQDLDLEPFRPRLENIAKSGHPFSICWKREVRPILSGLNSEYLTHPWGPWVADSPFLGASSAVSKFVPDSIGDGGMSSSGNYRDHFSTSSESSNDHFSAALGVTIGYPFLSASATAEYDKTVSKNRNGTKASRNASCRTGRLVLEKTPILSPESIKVLRSYNGQSDFRRRYGDFYVCGYSLGADAGAFTVKTFFSEDSVSKTSVEQSSSVSARLSFNGYSTLDQKPPCDMEFSSVPLSQFENLRTQSSEYLNKIKGLQKAVYELMESLGVVDSRTRPQDLA